MRDTGPAHHDRGDDTMEDRPVALARHVADFTIGEQYLGDFAAKFGLTQIDVAASDEQNRHQELDENLHA
jgi:hypothetical protein